MTDANGNVFTPGAGFRNQKWANNPGGSPIPLDVLSSLTNGDYTLEVFFCGHDQRSRRCVTDHFPEQRRRKLQGNFFSRPEPSISALLAGPILLGAWFFIRRRRV